MISTESPTRLSAAYASPTSTENFTYPLPTLSSSPITQEKTTYLSTLRSSVQKLQDEINAFLTKKMEEERNAASGANGVNGTKVDEQKEEENYGEEVVDED